MKSLKDHIQEKKMDPVGKADADIDNDGDVDSSDKYLHNRRKAIKKAMKKEETEQANEAMGDAAHKAAVKHITDLGKKNNKTFGQQRMHIDNYPGKHDEKTRQAAKTINKNQFGNWKKGKDGKMTQEETGSWKKDSGWKKTNKPGTVTDKSGAKHTPMSRAKHLAKQGMKNAFNKEEVGLDEVMSPESRKAHGRMFKARAKKQHDAQQQAEREKRLKAKGWVRNNRGGFSKEDLDEDVTTALKKKASKSGISVSTLRKVYNRGVAAWRTGHRPGTTPAQWGMARVNSYITKGKGTYHGADKDLREDIERHADVKMVKTKAPDGRPIWKKQRKETEVSKHNEGVDYHHIDDIEIAIGEFVGIEKLQEALNRLQQMKFAKAAKELKAYAKKRGGIDKKDFMMAAQLMDDGEAMELAKFVKKMDTDPRDYVHTIMLKHGLMKKR